LTLERLRERKFGNFKSTASGAGSKTEFRPHPWSRTKRVSACIGGFRIVFQQSLWLLLGFANNLCEKNIPNEIRIPDGLPIHGALLLSQLRAIDWRARPFSVSCLLPSSFLEAINAAISSVLVLDSEILNSTNEDKDMSKAVNIGNYEKGGGDID
jgi:hypothetical protein